MRNQRITTGPVDIPISAAQEISEKYGYDQVLIYGRRHSGEEQREYLITYGATKEDCRVAGLMSKTLQNFMGWKKELADKTEQEH